MIETYNIRTVKCANDIIEKSKYPIRIDPNRAKTREAKREINREAKNTSSSARNFARLLNHNFDRKDRHITVTISPEGMTKIQRRADSIAAKIKAKGKETPNVRDLLHLAMERELENWNRRILDACKKTGISFRYASAVSDIKNKDGLQTDVRLHIHAVVNKEAAEICISKWTLGEISRDQPLSEWKTASVYDWTRLANYIINQSRTIQDGKRYTISRNLEKPELKDRIAKKPFAELRPPRGAILLERSEYRRGWPQYIRYKLHPEDDEVEKEE